MDAAPRPIVFTSDYGTEDEFVGLCHLVIARIAPQVRVFDLAHGVRGVGHGAALLGQCVRYAPDAVYLAIVDPGVGTDRRGLIVRTASAALLIGPDNGLLIAAADVLGGVVDAFELAEPRYRLDPVSTTFHGRDIFAPAAAYAATGIEPPSFGPRLDPHELVRLPAPFVRVQEDLLELMGVGLDRRQGLGKLPDSA
jgi:S-adenosyl-L-methionine hydrolase (adenosine-forming)